MEFSDIKLLVADDEELFLDMIGDLFRRNGYNPDLASRGDTAIQMIKEKTYDVILTDIRMPGANGLEVLHKAKEKDHDSQVIVISAYGDADNILTALRLGAADFIQKPVEIPAFIPNIVERAIEKRRLLVENRQLIEDLKNRTFELEQALSTIKKQQEHLVHSERLKVLGTMSAGMAHEINNPLAFISTNIQTLEKYLLKLGEKLDTETIDTAFLMKMREGVDGILSGVHKGVSRISQITMALRTFSRKGPGVAQEISLKECIDDALNLLMPRLKNINLQLDLDDKEKRIQANQQNMIHAIMNFVQNSCDALENSDTKDLFVITKYEEDVQKLIVKDTGEGIPEEIKNKIFELFFTTKPVGKGSGLGLSIAMGVIEESGGQIDIESELGKGTTITVVW